MNILPVALHMIGYSHTFNSNNSTCRLKIEWILFHCNLQAIVLCWRVELPVSTSHYVPSWRVFFPKRCDLHVRSRIFGPEYMHTVREREIFGGAPNRNDARFNANMENERRTKALSIRVCSSALGDSLLQVKSELLC